MLACLLACLRKYKFARVMCAPITVFCRKTITKSEIEITNRARVQAQILSKIQKNHAFKTIPNRQKLYDMTAVNSFPISLFPTVFMVELRSFALSFIRAGIGIDVISSK